MRPVRLPPNVAPESVGCVLATLETAEFGRALVAFLTKWNLTDLRAWDLPDPQGILMADLPPNAPARPFGSITMSIPAGRFFQAGELDRMVADGQRARARETGVDPRYVALRHHEQYGTMLDVLHLERSILSRFPGEGRPVGVMTVMVEAIARALGLGPDRVTRIRKNIALCLSGKHESVKSLRVKT